MFEIFYPKNQYRAIQDLKIYKQGYPQSMRLKRRPETHKIWRLQG